MECTVMYVYIHNFVHALSLSMGAPMFGLGWLSFNSCVALNYFQLCITHQIRRLSQATVKALLYLTSGVRK